MSLLNYKEAQTNFKQILRNVPGDKATQENLKQCVNYLKKKEAFQRAIAGNEKSLVIYYVDYDGMLNVEVMGRARNENGEVSASITGLDHAHFHYMIKISKEGGKLPKKHVFTIVAKVHELCCQEYQRLVSDILCQSTSAEALKAKLLSGLPIRRAAYGVLRFTMAAGAKGVEVVISGKLRAARAKSQKYVDGFMIHSGQPTKDFIDSAIRHVLMRQGVLGIRVKIMRDPAKNKFGPKSLPDAVKIAEYKEEDESVPAPTVNVYRAKEAAPEAAPEAAEAVEAAA